MAEQRIFGAVLRRAAQHSLAPGSASSFSNYRIYNDHRELSFRTFEKRVTAYFIHLTIVKSILAYSKSKIRTPGTTPLREFACAYLYC